MRLTGPAGRAQEAGGRVLGAGERQEYQNKHRRSRGRADGRAPAVDARRYRERNTVERCFSKLEQFRAVATRYDKRDYMYQASIRNWLRHPVPDLRDTALSRGVTALAPQASGPGRNYSGVSSS